MCAVFLDVAGRFLPRIVNVTSHKKRLSQYISAHTAHTWHLLVADDFHLEAGGAGYREALMIFLFCVIRRVYRYRGRRPQAGTLSYGRFRNTPSLILSRRVGKEGRMVCEMVGNRCFCWLRQYGLLRGRTGKDCLCSRCARVRARISCTSSSLPHSSSSWLHEESSSMCVVIWQISSRDNDITIAIVLFYSLRTRRELMRRPVWKGLESEVGVRIGRGCTNGMISPLWLFQR